MPSSPGPSPIAASGRPIFPTAGIASGRTSRAPRYRRQVAKAEILDNCRQREGKHLGFFSEFATAEGEQVLLKVGISFVSVEGARANLAHDIDQWDFDKVRRQARAAWADALRGVNVEDSDAARKEVFATALYHSFIDPRSFSDVDGRYTGADGKVHRTGDFTYRTIFSGWDVFRSQYPMLTILRPDVVDDTVNSLIQQAELSGNGYLARWEILGVESGCMLGDPAISVFTDAYLKGIRHYDAEKAYALCRQTAQGPRTNRHGWQAYLKLGYTPGSISNTLESAYFDYCAGRFAEALGKKAEAAVFFRRAMNYRQYLRSVRSATCGPRTPRATGSPGRAPPGMARAAWRATPISRVGSCPTTCRA